MRRIIVLMICLSLLLSACQFSFAFPAKPLPAEKVIATATLVKEEPLEDPAPEGDPTSTPTPVEEEEVDTPTPTLVPVVINPLTGLPVQDPNCLDYPPAVISITNFPASARPQAGLDYANIVFEAWIGQGDTRFLAIFYCDYPQENSIDHSALVKNAAIGPVRSGRIWYEDIRQLMNGFIIMASAWSGVAVNLSDYANIFGSDEGNINSALIGVTRLNEIAKTIQVRLGKFDLSGNIFDENPPAGGVTGESVWIRYALLNQVLWRYRPDTGAYHRFNNDTQTGAEFTEATDRLNSNPLTYENVIIMFADHRALDVGYIEIDFVGVTRPALLFRDGKMYEIQWTTVNGEYEQTTGKRRPPRFTDKNGNPFPLKPGQTWVMVVPSYTRYYETLDSENIIQMLNNETPGSGHWAVAFRAPVIQK
jgi:hypothetical protein